MAEAGGYPDAPDRLTAIYRKARTSQRHLVHRIYAYLLRQLTITRPNHVWAVDIMYIPVRRRFVEFCVILNWVSRRVLAWRLSNALTTYNQLRPHRALDGCTPDRVYWESSPARPTAA